MIKFDIHFPTQSSLKQKDDVFYMIKEEKQTKKSGYYNLPYQNKALQDSIDYIQTNKDILKDISHIVIIGIGGSSLGLKAIDTMLYHLPHRNHISLKFLEHTDPLKIQKSLKKIRIHKSLFIVISKSGMTIETTSLMKYCVWRYNLLESSLKNRLLIITDNDSPLSNWARQNQIYTINIDNNIGGRFSVLSATGIVPLKLLGYKVEEILEGARILQDSFFNRSEEHILEKAIFMAKNHNLLPMNILFSYSSSFCNFNLWYMQLWGESLGKLNKNDKNIGLTPISLIGSIDQHSFLQLILEGKKDKTITFLSINQEHYNELAIPNINIRGLETTNFVNGISFARLLAAQKLATMKVLQNDGVPLDSIQIDLLHEKNIGALVMYYELLTSAVGCIFEIDTYNQPAVERGKRILYNYV
ncbi:glucose-6-phosphate isomerase [Helicobacter muridarum]|uniref:Glucose-6-phosphate isomerase n=1 Tax=Helicobacter muridarum TaxID=216 RepID=A0A099TW34_9HELI|nr:glucose-6-phosphate isomerase [Helicobacter muridarum]TLE00434.1 glucose-6-phosphate isomerase [Helicobacter muridarum]STQ86407.1 glucose-6-phosphate isomerase [Helicobacter muridarum]